MYRSHLFSLVAVSFATLVSPHAALADDGCEDEWNAVEIADSRAEFWCSEDQSVAYIAQQCADKVADLEERVRDYEECEMQRDSRQVK